MVSKFQDLLNKTQKLKTAFSSVLVLLKVIEIYGYAFSVSYMKIGLKLGVSSECVRKHFKALEKLGLISIEHSSTRRLVCRINEDKVNELL